MQLDVQIADVPSLVHFQERHLVCHAQGTGIPFDGQLGQVVCKGTNPAAVHGVQRKREKPVGIFVFDVVSGTGIVALDDVFAIPGKFGNIPIGKDGRQPEILIAIVDMPEERFFLHQRRVRHNHNIVRDRVLPLLLGSSSLLDGVINDRKDMVHLIGSRGKEADLLIVAPHMGNVLEGIKLRHLGRRKNQYQLHLVVRMERDDVQQDFV